MANLSPIYERLNSVEPYHPLSADTFADWAMEAGDIVTIERDGQRYTSPIHTSTLKWNGKQKIQINSDGNRKRDSISKVSQQKYAQGRGGGGGYGANQELFWEMYSEDGLLHGMIYATESKLRTEYSAMGSDLYSFIEQTATYIRAELGDAVNGLYGHIDFTASQLRTAFEAADSALYSYVDQTATYWRVALGNAEEGLYGQLEVTASKLRSDFTAADSQLYSYMEQTATNWRVALGNAEEGLYGQLELTASKLRSDFTAADSQLYSYVEQTATSWRVALGNAESGLYGQLEVTASKLQADFSAADSTLYGTIQATATSFTVSLGNTASSLYGTIQASASELKSEYSAADSRLYTFVQQTATSLSTTIANLDSKTSTRFEQTDSRIAMTVGQVKYTRTVTYGSTASLPSTGDPGALYRVGSTYYLYNPGTKTYMPATVDGFGNANYVQAGEIALAFNEQTGGTVARIDADKVQLGRSFDQSTLPEWMNTTTGVVAEKATIVDLNAVKARVGTLETDYLKTNQLKATIGNLDGVNVTLLDASGSIRTHSYLTVDGVINAWGGIQTGNGDVFKVLDASVDGNTLTIKKTDGKNVTFSKATTLTGSWSDGKYTVEASPQGNKLTMTPSLVLDGDGKSTSFSVKLKGDGTDVGVSKYVYLVKSGTGKDTYVNACGTSSGSEMVGRIAVGTLYTDGYNKGWGAAYSKLSLPARTNTSSATMTVKYPSVTVDKAGEDINYTVSVDKSYAYIKRGSVTVARTENGQYAAGWEAARSKFSSETSSSTDSTLTMTFPPTTVDGNALTRTYYLTLDDNYAYIRYGSSTGTTVARVTNTKKSGSDITGLSSSWDGNVFKVSTSTSSTTKSADCTVGIYPSEDKTLGYGKSVTVSALGNGYAKKSITITAPEDNSAEAWSSGHTAGFKEVWDHCWLWAAKGGGEQGTLAYDTAYAVGYEDANGTIHYRGYWMTPPDNSGSGGGHSIAMSDKVRSIGTNRGSRASAGSISKSGISANTYLGFSVKCGDASKAFYIAVNA